MLTHCGPLGKKTLCQFIHPIVVHTFGNNVEKFKESVGSKSRIRDQILWQWIQQAAETIRSEPKQRTEQYADRLHEHCCYRCLKFVNHCFIVVGFFVNFSQFSHEQISFTHTQVPGPPAFKLNKTFENTITPTLSTLNSMHPFIHLSIGIVPAENLAVSMGAP